MTPAKPAIRRIRAGRSGHRYTIDGEPAPGVTTILGATMPKPALTDWAARTAADEAVNNWEALSELPRMQRHAQIAKAHTRDRDAAARRGTEVHRLGEALAVGEEVDVPDELAGHVDSYVRFLDTVEPAPLENGLELVLASRAHYYCGTADLIADLPQLSCDGLRIPAGRWLLDLKTTRSGVWPETALQLAFYRHADTFLTADGEERRGDWLGIKHTGVVWISSDAWELRTVDTGRDVWDCCLRLRGLYEDLQHKDEWIGSTCS